MSKIEVICKIIRILKYLPCFLMVAQVVFAKDLVRRQIKPIGFAKDSLMIFHSMDLACGCKNGNCKFKDESGDFD